MTLVYGFILGVASSIVASILYRVAQLAWRNRHSKVALQAEIVPDVAEWALTVALASILPQDGPVKVEAPDLREWLDRLGAVEIGEVTTGVRLKGLAGHDVLITNISATIIQHLDRLSSTRVVNPDAGATDRLSLYFDLDHSPEAPVQPAWCGAPDRSSR